MRRKSNEYDHLYQSSLYLLLFMGMLLTMVVLMGAFLLVSESFQGVTESQPQRAIFNGNQDSSVTKDGKTTILQGEQP